MLVIVVNTIEEVDLEPFETLASDSYYTRGWLKTVELLQENFAIEPRYLIAYEGSEAIAFLPAFIARNLNRFNVKKKNLAIKTAVKLAVYLGVHLDSAPTLVCNPFNCSLGRVMLRENYDMKVVFRSLSAKVDEICKKAIYTASNVKPIVLGNLSNQTNRST